MTNIRIVGKEILDSKIRLHVVGKDMFDEDNNRIVLKSERCPHCDSWGGKVAL